MFPFVSVCFRFCFRFWNRLKNATKSFRLWWKVHKPEAMIISSYFSMFSVMLDLLDWSVSTDLWGRHRRVRNLFFQLRSGFQEFSKNCPHGVRKIKNYFFMRNGCVFDPRTETITKRPLQVRLLAEYRPQQTGNKSGNRKPETETGNRKHENRNITRIQKNPSWYLHFILDMIFYENNSL